MKKAIFFGILSLSLLILIISWKKNDGQSKEKYLQKNLSSYSVSANDLSRLRSHFTEVTQGKFITQKAWLSVKDMKSMIANLDDDANIEIFFAAYQEQDLQRYKMKDPANYLDKKDREALLFRVPSENGKGHVNFDIAKVCPEPPDCSDDPPVTDNK
jgi:hypothetical protein